MDVCSNVESMFVDYSGSAVGHLQCDRHICLGAYARSVKCIHTSACGHDVDCSEVMSGICT